MDDANNTTVVGLDDPPPSELNDRMLGLVGIVALLISLFILAVFFSSRRLLSSSSLFVGLTIGHALNGLIHAMYGFWSAAYQHILVSPLYCIQLVWPNLFITTYQLLPLLLALAGTERLLALVVPLWYRTHCTYRRQWLITAAAFIYGLITMGISWLLASYNNDHLLSASCIPPLVVGFPYMIYGVHTPALLGGVWATICTAIGVHAGQRKLSKMPSSSKGEIARMNKQIRLAKCLLTISAIDIACVVVPNLIFILFNTALIKFPMADTTFVVMVYCSDSIWNIFAFVLFNAEFRRSSIRLLTCGKTTVVHSVVADGTTFGQTGSTKSTNAKNR